MQMLAAIPCCYILMEHLGTNILGTTEYSGGTEGSMKPPMTYEGKYQGTMSFGFRMTTGDSLPRLAGY